LHIKDNSGAGTSQAASCSWLDAAPRRGPESTALNRAPRDPPPAREARCEALYYGWVDDSVLTLLVEKLVANSRDRLPQLKPHRLRGNPRRFVTPKYSIYPIAEKPHVDAFGLLKNEVP
jgi:hypothetical protein